MNLQENKYYKIYNNDNITLVPDAIIKIIKYNSNKNTFRIKYYAMNYIEGVFIKKMSFNYDTCTFEEMFGTEEQCFKYIQKIFNVKFI